MVMFFLGRERDDGQVFVGFIYGRGASQNDLMIDAISFNSNLHQDSSCLLMHCSDIFLNR